MEAALGRLTPREKLPFKKEIESILGHTTDSKCGVRFHVKWKDYHSFTKERSGFILTFQEGKPILAAYLHWISIHNKRRWEFLVSRQPDLWDLIKPQEEPQEEPQDQPEDQPGEESSPDSSQYTMPPQE